MLASQQRTNQTNRLLEWHDLFATFEVQTGVVCLLQTDGLDLGELGVQEAAARRGVLPDGEHPAAQAPDSAVLARRPAP